MSRSFSVRMDASCSGVKGVLQAGTAVSFYIVLACGAYAEGSSAFSLFIVLACGA